MSASHGLKNFYMRRRLAIRDLSIFKLDKIKFDRGFIEHMGSEPIPAENPRTK